MKNQDKKTILVVDDQVDLLDLIKEELEEKGYRVLTASDGEKAMNTIVTEGIPNLILLDMKMPVMDGWTFAHRFTDLYGRACPIVIMTAADDSSTRAMEIGADSYLGKPFNLNDLENTVKSMLVG